jgi:hypothetical protein
VLVSGVREDERGCFPLGTGMDDAVEGRPRAMDEWGRGGGARLL